MYKPDLTPTGRPGLAAKPNLTPTGESGASAKPLLIQTEVLESRPKLSETALRTNGFIERAKPSLPKLKPSAEIAAETFAKSVNNTAMAHNLGTTPLLAKTSKPELNDTSVAEAQKVMNVFVGF